MIETVEGVATLLDLFNPAAYRFSWMVVPHLAAAAAIALLATLIWRWERGSRISLMYASFSALFIFWAIGRGLFAVVTEPALLVYIASRMYVSAAVGVALLVHFILTLIHRDVECRGMIWLTWVMGILFAVLARDTPLVVAGLREMPWGYAPAHGWAGTALTLWIGALMAYVAAQVWRVLRAARPGTIERKRLNIFSLATLLLYFSAVDFLNGEGLPVYPAGSLPVLLFTLVSAYVTWKYGLVEVNAQLVARQLADMMRGAVLILDRENIIRFANAAAIKIFGLPRRRLLGQPASAALGEAFSGASLAALARSERGDTEKELIFRQPDNGELRDLAVSAVAVHDAHQRQVALICLARDNTEQKRAEKEQARERLIDTLTTLPNRAMFLGLLDAAAERAELEHGYHYAVCFIGMDRMRVVNDDLGYSAGDLLLREVGERLRRAARPQDTVARVGGDEFAVLIRSMSEREDILAYIERLRSLLMAPMTLSGQELFVSACIGAAGSSGGHWSGAELLRNASIAMHQAKQDSSAGVHFAAGGEQRPQRLRLEAELRHAIENRQIQAYYQPVLDLYERRVFGFEALARWHHPARGVLLPAEFIDLAGELGLATAIDLQVLRAACHDLPQLQQIAALHPPTLSLNLSEDCLRQPGIAAQVGEIIARNGLEARHLSIEVLERMVHIEPARVALQALRDLGMGLYVDDFGTGYSALSRLHALPLTALKIDREFVRAMSRGDGSDKVVAGIVALARNLGFDVIAEGVSTADEAARLGDAGCRYVQGFFFSPAQPFAETLELCGEAEPFGAQFAEIERLRPAAGARQPNLTLIQREPWR